MKESNMNGISRRDFLKTSAVVSAAGLSGLVGCTPKIASDQSDSAEINPSADQKWSFEIPPESISASKIKETKEADVVILGAGIAGVCAAMASVENGAKTIVLEKREMPTFHGGWCGVIDSRRQKELGIKVDANEIVAELMRWGAYKPNQQLIQKWAKESGRIMDKLLDMADAVGLETTNEPSLKTTNIYKDYDISLRFLPAWNATLVPLVEKTAKEAGVEFIYNAPAVQLIKNTDGRITGVMAKNGDSYLQVNANAVIICTGGYENNPEMLAKYIPRAAKAVTNWYSEGSTTGDGIKMGLWAGAAMQDGGHCPMFFDGGFPKFPLPIGLSRQPWLNVNILGERYANEDAPFGYTCNQDMLQPGNMKWSVWDGKWESEVEKFQGVVCERLVPPLWTPEILEQANQAGFIIQADTLEELAKKMEVPWETFTATVDRYNELARKGRDDDFGKNPIMLTTIENGPFFASKSGAALVVTLDGLQINPDMQVLDTSRKPIPGLYAAGNASGNFFAEDYAITVVGVSHGRALTFGWLAGENATKEIKL